jgi:uncharacterized protein (TIGR03083 family)
MTMNKAELRQALDDSRALLNRVLDQVGDRWETPVYSDGLQWTVRQIVAHLADADRGHNNQAMNIAEGRDIIPPDFDIQRYNARTTEKSAAKSGDQARAELAESRAALLPWLDAVDDAKLALEGRHASLRVMPVWKILMVTASHEQGHAKDIAAALGITI